MKALELVVAIITVITNLFLGWIVFSGNKKSATHKYLALITLVIALWTISNYFSLNSSTETATLFWIRFVMVATTPLAPLLYLFFKAFPGDKLGISKKFLFLITIICIVVAGISASPLTFSEVSIDEGVVPKTNFGAAGFGLLTVGFLLASFWVSIIKYKSSDLVVRTQFKTIALGAILTFSLQIITNFLMVVMFNYSSFVVFGPFFSLILIGSMTYAILKQHFLSIKIIAVQIFTAFIIISLLAKLFVSNSFPEFVVDATIFCIVAGFSFLLIRSVNVEIKQKEELQKLMTKLKELDSQKNEFINMAAHELRAPLSAIKGFVSMIMEGDTGDIPEKTRGYLADVNSINSRLVRLVNNMLNVSRIEEGRMAYVMEDEQLSHVARAVYSEFTPEAQRKELDYKLDIPNNIHDKVKIDTDKINEVMGNFISNALKYTEKGSVTVRLTQQNKNLVRFEVVDTGPGISETEQKKLFQKFYRVESNVGKTTGTGLGLYISKLMIEKFGGKIGLSSETDKGSIFWFELSVIQ